MMNSEQEMLLEAYTRAEQLLPWNIYQILYNTYIKPHWINERDEFWYKFENKELKKFILISPMDSSKKEAFDHEELAKSISEGVKKSYDPKKLPFDEIILNEKENTIEFAIKKNQYVLTLENFRVISKSKKELEPQGELKSPDNKWAAYLKDHNVYVRSLLSGEEIGLTNDGVQHDDYGLLPESSTYEITIRRWGFKLPPIAIWSPDSKKLAIHKIDQTQIKEMYLIQSVALKESQRPILHSYKYPLPEDKELGKSELVVLDIEKKSKIIAKYKPQEVSYVPPIFYKHVWWSQDGQKLYYIYYERGFKAGRLLEVDAETGNIRVILEENVSTHIDLNQLLGQPPNVRILEKSNELIWFSQKSGWGHLYLHDLKTGELKNQITSGEWLVRDILYLDENERWVYFLAGGREKDRDPYYRHLYRAKLDGSTIELLTPENADHQIDFSPTGNYFVDNIARASTTPTAVLRKSNGELVMPLETAEIDELYNMGWNHPKEFKVKARDGTTDIYGLIFYPSTFNPEKKYPIIDAIYPGPQVIRTPKQFPLKVDRNLTGYWDPQAMAELGFIVITVDGFGTPLRSKAFQDFSYGNFKDGGGIQDHVIAFQQLQKDHPYMDLDRVGIYGHSGGGFASARAILMFPEFYKVAVSSAGNHDQRGYVAEWGEKYQGLLKGNNYDDQVNAKLAPKLEGKLMLMYGDLDDNVHPSLTLQLIDALIKANKDFDMLVLPNRNHMFSNDEYYVRKRWDYFVQHLLGVTPPKEYKLKAPKMEFLMELLMQNI